jgi:hypothetical protein
VVFSKNLQIANKIMVVQFGIGSAKESNVARLVVVLFGEPKVPEVLGKWASGVYDCGRREEPAARARLNCLCLVAPKQGGGSLLTV